MIRSRPGLMDMAEREGGRLKRRWVDRFGCGSFRSTEERTREEREKALERAGHERRREEKETSSSPIERRKTQDDRAFDFENLLGMPYELSILGCTKSRLEEREWSWGGDERRSRTSPLPSLSSLWLLTLTLPLSGYGTTTTPTTATSSSATTVYSTLENFLLLQLDGCQGLSGPSELAGGLQVSADHLSSRAFVDRRRIASFG